MPEPLESDFIAPLIIPSDGWDNVVEEKAWWRSLLLGKLVTGVLTNTKNNIVGLEIDYRPIYIVNGNGYFGTLMVVAGDVGEVTKLLPEQVEEWSKPKGKSPPKQNKSNLPPTKSQTQECLDLVRRYLETARGHKETTLGAPQRSLPPSALTALEALEHLIANS